MRIQGLLLIRFPRRGGAKFLESCLKSWSFSPRSRPSAFMTMLSMAMVAQALLVVWEMLDLLRGMWRASDLPGWRTKYLTPFRRLLRSPQTHIGRER